MTPETSHRMSLANSPTDSSLAINPLLALNSSVAFDSSVVLDSSPAVNPSLALEQFGALGHCPLRKMLQNVDVNRFGTYDEVATEVDMENMLEIGPWPRLPNTRVASRRFGEYKMKNREKPGQLRNISGRQTRASTTHGTLHSHRADMSMNLQCKAATELHTCAQGFDQVAIQSKSGQPQVQSVESKADADPSTPLHPREDLTPAVQLNHRSSTSSKARRFSTRQGFPY